MNTPCFNYDDVVVSDAWLEENLEVMVKNRFQEAQYFLFQYSISVFIV